MVQQLTYLKETASQTAGPYVHIGLIPGMAGFDIFEKNFTNILTGPNTKGERITLEGRVLDGTGTPLRDVLLEIWQADAAGRYNILPIVRPAPSTGISAAGAAPDRISTPG
jgi:protocatechuate 3,4-dioxygenase alpha subunit